MAEKYRSALGLMPTTTKYKHLIAQISNSMNILTFASLTHSNQTWSEKVASTNYITRQKINHFIAERICLFYLDMILNGCQLYLDKTIFIGTNAIIMTGKGPWQIKVIHIYRQCKLTYYQYQYHRTFKATHMNTYTMLLSISSIYDYTIGSL